MGYEYFRADEITPAGYSKRPEPKPYPAWKFVLDLLVLAAVVAIAWLAMGA